MNQKSPQTNPQRNGQQPALDNAALSQFLDNQAKQLELEASRIKLREKELEHNAKLASESMKHNSDLMKNAPWEHRKNIRTYALIGGSFVVVMLVFIGYCLHSNHEEFVLKFLQLIAYVVVTAIGYFAGVQRGKRVVVEKKNEIEDAEIVD